MASPAEDREDQSGDDKILTEMKERFNYVREFESNFRTLYVADVKFANADPDNGWQWPDDIRRQRERDVNPRPCLTINKIGPLVLQITNEARKNKPGIKIRPVGAEVSFEAAQILEGIIRYIERISRAQTIYDDCMESTVEGGISYWVVRTQYEDDDSFDQDIRICPVRNHMNVYLDRNIKQKDGSDALYGFLFDELPEKEFKKQYPNVDITVTTGFDVTDDWVQKDNIRVAEYYRIEETDDELIYLRDDKGTEVTFKRSEVPQQLKKSLAAAEKPGSTGHDIKKRKIKKKQLEWFKVAGNTIIDRRKLKGKYIPIVRLVGREKIIEGRLDRKGHVRPLKDPQRMYNYNSSGQVEYGALATKSPWVAAAAAIEGNQTAWFNANRQNAAVLTFKHIDEDGNPIPPPQKPEAPGASPAFLEGMRIASAEIEMASGQVIPQQQNPSLERTPRAIDMRLQSGQTATYHFIDNLGIAIAHTGNIILDLIPEIYDTERVRQILARDGSQQKVLIKPDAEKAYEEAKNRDDVAIIFNPKVGKYEVEADVGPAYATQRLESWNAFVQIVSNSPELTAKIGDLGFKAADFPMADEIAERLRRDIRANAPWLLDDEEIGPFVKNLQTQLQQAMKDSTDKDTTIGELLANVAEKQLQLKGKDVKGQLDSYKAETDRIVGLGNTVADMGYDVLKPLIRQTLAEMLGFTLKPVAHELQTQIDKEVHDFETTEPEPAGASE